MISIITLLFIGNTYFSPPSLETASPIPGLVEFQISSLEARLPNQMELSADAALVMEVSSGMILYEKNIHKRLPIASLTKLMTALVTLEKTPLTALATVPATAPAVEGRKAYLASGEEISVADLLRALLIHSGNDAAVTLAAFGNETNTGFVEKMNRRAHWLGLTDTSFANAHGLDDEKNYSSAFDITLIAKMLLPYDFVRETVNEKTLTIKDTSGKSSHLLRTTNELLFTDFPVYGMKTGTTELAGECFVGLIRLQQKDYLITILGSADRFHDTKALIWALQNRDTL